MIFIKLLYISGGVFPEGSAYASRIVNFARLFHGTGIDVHIIVDFPGHRNLVEKLGNGIYEESTFEILSENQSLATRIKLPFICASKVNLYLKNNSIDVVVIGSLSDRFKFLFSEIKRRGIPIILESCEWHDSSSFRGGAINPLYFQFLKCWRFDFIKADGVIAISRLLESHYRQYSQNVIRIPTILDSIRTVCNLTTINEKIKLMYAGNPGNAKELISNIIVALSLLGENKNRFTLDLYGPNRNEIAKQLKSNFDLLDNMKNVVFIHGKVSQNLINEKYMKSDYGIFLRSDTRKNEAGFPTKLAECMMAGTPIICNDTGDIGLYVENYRNGFLLNDSSPDTLKEVLQEILNLSINQRIAMRKEARLTAESYFDYRNYMNDLKDFILYVCHQKQLIRNNI